MPKKEKVGEVVSNKMDKTAVVKIVERRPHVKYGKIQTMSVKFKAHDEKNECQIGDRVRIVECRPMSADKRWAVLEVIERPQLV
ncbi:MAG: 30S ribosomal protein S17 [Vampirovibrionales bacterium]|nr:30S ribosomal protein S17 [Vampirovibrionales bacterium]